MLKTYRAVWSQALQFNTQHTSHDSDPVWQKINKVRNSNFQISRLFCLNTLDSATIEN